MLVENEVNLVALAEHRLGAARGQENFALIAYGPGVGMAVFLDGRLRRGRSGGAGELSYLPVGLEGGPYHRAIDTWTTASGDFLREGGPEALDRMAEVVAFGVVGACAVLDPGFVVLAGHHGRAGGAALAERVAERIGVAIPLPTRVVAAAVDGDPVVRGAVQVALERLLDQTFS
ncbi:hypothetical protein GCM10009560_43190 [Nonomuraea longicatena]|uniref:ROK family protein n=1 Tax=Nonomuraea longicatena TaxID=83682 RepID=A0ABP4AFV8_9ACTN